MQFYETYRAAPKLSPLVRELSWTHNLLIMSRCKREEEREFYLRFCHRERWGKRELERQLAGALFERTVLSPAKLSPAVTESHPAAAEVFKDTYLLDFLDLPADALRETDLQRALVDQLKQFLIELGRDFCFIGSRYVLQVGGGTSLWISYFSTARLNCLVAIRTEDRRVSAGPSWPTGILLEALDRDVRKPHEGPSIGVLLCATKDHEVVKYALSRAASPALVAEYQTRLPDKALLQAKLHEFYELAREESTPPMPEPPPPIAKKRSKKKSPAITNPLVPFCLRPFDSTHAGQTYPGERGVDAGAVPSQHSKPWHES